MSDQISEEILRRLDYEPDDLDDYEYLQWLYSDYLIWIRRTAHDRPVC